MLDKRKRNQDADLHTKLRNILKTKNTLITNTYINAKGELYCL